MNDSFQPIPPAVVRQGPDTEAAKQVLRGSALEWFEREDGLPVVGFRIDSPTGLANEVDWHTHGRAQLICVESGLLTTRTRHGTWSLAPGSAGWMPAAEPHTVAIDGPLRGWGMVLAPALCHDLPADPCVIGISPLLQAVALRVCDWPIADAASAPQQHLIEVVALVEMAKQATFEQGAEYRATEQRQRQGEPGRSRGMGHQVGHVGADHEQGAMGQINDPHDPKNQRQSAGDQEKEQPVLD
ncbi:MAG: AraC family ligand binding domain-containing protein, partial [Stenotrophomonas sp.]|nr:AraC family ligand binding domain-containing protein [Stenotrophomonas sp.]